MALNKQMVLGILLPTVIASAIIVGSTFELVRSENNNLKQEVGFLSNQVSALKIKLVPAEVGSKVALNAIDSELYLVQSFLHNDWVVTTSDNGLISFSYPKNLFSPQYEGDYQGSGLMYEFEAVQPVDKGDLDNVCEGLGDPDCPAFNSVKQRDIFTKAIAGKGDYRMYGETLTLAEKTIKVQGIPFIAAVTNSPNGECSLRYVTFLKDIKITFSANICDDALVPSSSQPWKASKELKTWAAGVIDGTQGDFATNIKRDALLSLLATLQVK